METTEVPVEIEAARISQMVRQVDNARNAVRAIAAGKYRCEAASTDD